MCHMLSWFWKTSMKAGTEETEEQARHAWKDEVMREETRHKDSQRLATALEEFSELSSSCESCCGEEPAWKELKAEKKRQIIILIHIILKEGYATLSALMTAWHVNKICILLSHNDIVRVSVTSFTLKACFASDVLHDHFLLINDRHSCYPNDSSKSHDDSPHSTLLNVNQTSLQHSHIYSSFVLGCPFCPYCKLLVTSPKK